MKMGAGWERLECQRGGLVHLDVGSFLCPLINATDFTILRSMGRRVFIIEPSKLVREAGPLSRYARNTYSRV